MPREVFVLGVIAFCVMVGFGVVLPVLPVYAASFGVGNFEVGAVVSAFALMRLICSPFCPRLINLLGERLVLGIGIYIVAVSSGLTALAQDYPQLLILRGLGGIGSAMFTVSAMTLLLTSVPADRRGRATGIYQGGFLLGGMAGPAVGGVLATISLTAPFVFYAGTLIVAGTVGLLLLHTSGQQLGGTEQPPVPFREVVADKRYQAACLTNLAQGWTSMGVRSALVPVLIVEVLHGKPAWTGIAFACAAVVQTIMLGPAGRFSDTVGRRPAMIIGGALATAMIMIVAFAPNIWLLGLALCGYGAASAFLGTAPAAAVGDAAGGRAGRPVAIFSMCSDIGAIVGPLVAGALSDRVSYPAAFAVGATLLLVGVAASARMPRTAPVLTPRST
ncbi:MFS transporter [Microlunatus elymi]|uniref:MFS transporter n=2 Tax=Microlunatus elymi TaxID=2596828 RepID=A0A516Q6E3_9ACTN|nr:MFS transporter [Microlunatus elymi]